MQLHDLPSFPHDLYIVHHNKKLLVSILGIFFLKCVAIDKHSHSWRSTNCREIFAYESCNILFDFRVVDQEQLFI